MNDYRKNIQAHYLADEKLVFDKISHDFNEASIDFMEAQHMGEQLISHIRKKSQNNIFDAFWQEYSLSGQEGIMLMGLAEAMLRTPDKYNQDALIMDKINHESWGEHLGKSSSFLVNASSWGLFLTHKFLQLNPEQKESFKDRLGEAAVKTSQPIIRTAVKKTMEMMGKQFVLGENINKALKQAQKGSLKGWRYSFDMLGEGARSRKDAQQYYESYKKGIEAIGQISSPAKSAAENQGVSVKISAIYPRFEPQQKGHALLEIVDLLMPLCLLAKKYNIGFNIDAEEAERLELTLDIFKALLQKQELNGWDGLGIVVQSYQKRCPFVIDWLYEEAKKNNKKIMVRLVKGAYWDSEIKHYQELGEIGYPVWTRKETTDAAYLLCAKKLIDKADIFYPQFATHNAATAAQIMAMLKGKNIPCEFQRLHGMGEDLHEKIMSEYHIPSRIYAPVGSYDHLLSYLIRRLLENSANSSFVHLVSNPNIPMDELLQNPFEIVDSHNHLANDKITWPQDIFGESRKNSKGYDLSDERVLEKIDSHIQSPLMLKACSLTAHENENDKPHYQKIYAPFDKALYIGEKAYISASKMEDIYEKAKQSLEGWQNTSVQHRAELLLKTADMIEENWLDYMNLCMYEAGKMRMDAIAEIREAVDFCRYYAMEAQKLKPEQKAGGVWVCISPWNFPLAIFIGQISAALVAGNSVIAKPAEQTSLMAYYTVQKMHELGFPQDALQLVLGEGDVGAALTQLKDLAGVAFTGSTEVAKLIQKSLSQHSPYATLIAETGGQNAMIVDSTALPEQVVDDVIRSSFQSAGQRCSSARILCIQKEAYPAIVELLKGAMMELKMTSPLNLSCDVGPVIDGEAKGNLKAYIEEKSASFKLAYQLPYEAGHDKGHFVAPTLFEIKDLSQLSAEQFGPILHVMAYDISERAELMQKLHSLGYGLTAGIHSRISYLRDEWTKGLNIGNIYVNRNQIGAIVGMQPFGGLGLSGTGPKAGGPHYLPRFTQIKAEPILGLDTLIEGNDFKAVLSTEPWPKYALSDVITAWQKQSILLDLTGEAKATLDGFIIQLKEAWLPLFQKEEKLPAITGEENILTLQPKGTILVDVGKSNLGNLLAIMAALSAGNQVIVTKPIPQIWRVFLNIDGQLPLVSDKGLKADKAIDGILSTGEKLPFWANEAAKAEGKIISIYNQEFMFYQKNGKLHLNLDMLAHLTTEKTISTDIARTVGNTELMSL